MTEITAFLSAVNSFANMRILVIGDLILDVYLKGKSTRLCPEAPVPVVDLEEKSIVLGGAANTVCNLRSLGATVIFCTVIGKDAEGDQAIHLLRNLHIDEERIIRDPKRKTMTKSRVVSATQLITRIDQGSEEEIDAPTAEVLIDHIHRAYAECDAVILSDYAKGVITPGVLGKFCDLANRQRKFVAVDSKRLAFFAPLQPSYAKPNYDEALKILNLSHAPDRAEQIKDYAETLCRVTNTSLISVTLDADGSVILEDGRPIYQLPAQSVERPHVAGAGDSYISAFVLGYVHSGNPRLSADLAAAAAAIAIRKEGTAPCTHAELKSHFRVHAKYITDLEDLREICDTYHQTGKRVVFTNGCFDILHSGHVTYLHKARKLGDVMIVGLNTDESIKRIKGDDRPINGLADRLQVLAGLASVDHIIPFGFETDDTPIPLIRAVRPHVFAKGGDYVKEKLPEAETVEACGGQIVFIEQVPDHSTTRIIHRISALTGNNAHIAFSGSE